MPIRLYDSLSRQHRVLAPAHSDGVYRFYNCGPTVYAAAHIGNFRTFLVNDVLRRLLDLEFGPERVRHVRNLTDVDDKTIRRSREEGRSLSEVTRLWTGKFHADCAALGCLPPHAEPTATGHVREQVDMIDVLLDKGNAYRAPDGSVYFKVSSFPGYGALSRIRERELQPGAALKTAAADADEKEDGSDFALWKAWKEGDGPVKWPGPRGAAEGRPGWHIECSAMSKKLLGDTIDLHTGGVDLLFPHHENEIAQSECCNGAAFARHWFHSEHLLVDGKKMSKSLGNLYTLDDLAGKGFSPMAVRYALLSGHPRKQLNFTLDSLHAAESALDKLRACAATLGLAAGAPAPAPAPASQPASSTSPSSSPSDAAGPFAEALAALRDDLNTPAALGALHTAAHGSLSAADAPSFAAVIAVLGLDLSAPPAKQAPTAPAAVTALAERRWQARQAKDFAASDTLRAELAAAGWSMLDRKDGYSLEPLRGRT